MGLHAHITQSGRKVEIRISGALHSRAIAQVEAIVEHFRQRGCEQISLVTTPRDQSPLERAQDEVFAQARDLVKEFAIRR